MKANGEDREYFMVRIQHKRDGDGNSRRGTPLENPLFTTNVKKKGGQVTLWSLKPVQLKRQKPRPTALVLISNTLSLSSISVSKEI